MYSKTMDIMVKITLLLAVAVMYPVMVALGIEAFYPGPEVDYNECYRVPAVREDVPLTQEEQDARFQEEKVCRERLDSLREPHEARVFTITAVLGLAAVAAGALFFTGLTGPAGPGLVLGGMATIIYGTARTFQTVDKQWLFVVAFLTLAGMVGVSWRWFSGNMKNGKKVE